MRFWTEDPCIGSSIISRAINNYIINTSSCSVWLLFGDIIKISRDDINETED